MGKPLLIVESPTKVRTIEKILGKRNFSILATQGHLIDLPKKDLGVDVERGFALRNQVIASKKKFLTQIKKAVKDAKVVYMATDPDREGEAIAVLLSQHLKLQEDRVRRVLFTEITEKGIRAALEAPGPLDERKFQAQQARRAIDRLVGYKVSPVLWKRIRRGLSAGRVQSVALRFICEREREVRAFRPEDYFLVTSVLAAGQPPAVRARLTSAPGEKADSKGIRLAEEARATAIREELRGLTHTVAEVLVKPARRSPPPPFITSTLQQEAARKLRFSARKTMSVAQSLYEGVTVGERGTMGLITYMRTDSVRVSAEAVEAARGQIASRFGTDHLPSHPRAYRNRKGAQDAHEAIRPSSPDLEPAEAAQYLDREQARLYELIYKRFIASQMADQRLERTRADISAGPYGLTASGQRVLFSGFAALYEEGRDDDGNGEPDLPPLAKGQALKVADVETEMRTTQPPPRYTEATLVKVLEEKGIGRPSTYAAIIETITKRAYVSKDKGRFVPTTLGMAVNDYLLASFPRLIDVGFTAEMEEELDTIEEGAKEYAQVLGHFFSPFSQELGEAEKGEGRIPLGETDLACPSCKERKLVIKSGRTGEFLGCSGYPECRFTSNFTRNEDGSLALVAAHERTEKCPECGSPMLLRQSRGGPFLGCSRYPDCRGTMPLSSGVPCPLEGCGGHLVQKRTRKGRTFFGCNRYPDCKFAVWDTPVSRACPACAFPLMTARSGRGGQTLACARRECGHRLRENEGGEEDD